MNFFGDNSYQEILVIENNFLQLFYIKKTRMKKNHVERRISLSFEDKSHRNPFLYLPSDIYRIFDVLDIFVMSTRQIGCIFASGRTSKSIWMQDVHMHTEKMHAIRVAIVGGCSEIYGNEYGKTGALKCRCGGAIPIYLASFI